MTIEMEDRKFLTLIKEGILSNWDKPALTDFDGETFLYKDFARKIAEMHMYFDAIGLQKGEAVAICGRNSSHWAIVFFATVSYGAVITTILHDFDEESIHNIVNHSEAKVFFANDQVWNKVDPLKIPKVETIIQIDDFAIKKSNSPKLIGIRAERKKYFSERYPNGFSKEDVKFYDEQPEEMAVLNYTSGTTSSPKGVMLPFRSLWSNTRFAIDMIPFVKAGDGIVCMLPMAHMYGLAFEVLLSIAKGCHIHFLNRTPSPQVILKAFKDVNPTLVLAVPLIIEKIIQSKVFPEFEKQPVKTMLHIPFLRKRIYKKVADKITPLFGNKLVEVVIGGAALNKEVGQFLSDIRFPYTVGYGMTECGPLVSYEYWETYKPESCGRPVDRMQIKVDSQNPEVEVGELMVKGDNVMLGYFKKPEETASVLSEDGWLKTGDLVTVDKDNFIFIKGRSKTMILGASGQNIYPEEIEDLLNNSPYISEALVIEEDRKLIALIYPDRDYLENSGVKEKDYMTLFSAELKAVNKRLPNFSTLANFRLQDKEFEKTPKRSIKRFLYQK
jgi:long-chain acyl-CoA synthetase